MRSLIRRELNLIIQDEEPEDDTTSYNYYETYEPLPYCVDNEVIHTRIWNYKGINCCICSSPFCSSFNGYVRLPDNHPFVNLSYAEITSISIHGGLTYSEKQWIGFDTAHSGDCWPEELLVKYNIDDYFLKDILRFNEINRSVQWSTEWTIELLIKEVDRLAQQVIDTM